MGCAQRSYEEHPGAPRPPGEPATSNITLNAWTPRLQTLEDIAPCYALEYTVSFDGLSGCTAAALGTDRAL